MEKPLQNKLIITSKKPSIRTRVDANSYRLIGRVGVPLRNEETSAAWIRPRLHNRFPWDASIYIHQQK